MLSISKNIFYDDGRAFQETEPPTECKAHSACNCTRYVATKPTDGGIKQIRFGLSFNSGRKSDFVHNGKVSGTVGLGTFNVGNETDPERDRIWFTTHLPDKKHIYSSFYKNRIHFEYYVPNYGHVGYMFPNIFRGNDVDRHGLFNGHSYPKIDTVVKGEKQLWTYECHWGKECMHLITSHAEDLHSLFDLGQTAFEILSKININSELTAKAVSKIVKKSNFLETATSIERILRNFDLPNNPIFHELHDVECQTTGRKSMFGFAKTSIKERE